MRCWKAYSDLIRAFAEAISEAGPREVSDSDITKASVDYTHDGYAGSSADILNTAEDSFEAGARWAMRQNIIAKWPSDDPGSAAQRGRRKRGFEGLEDCAYVDGFLDCYRWLKEHLLGGGK